MIHSTALTLHDDSCATLSRHLKRCLIDKPLRLYDYSLVVWPVESLYVAAETRKWTKVFGSGGRFMHGVSGYL